MHAPGLNIVATAINGEQGVEAAARELPDIVLMDIRMPVMDGLEAAQRILSARRVCVIMLTAFNDEANVHKAHEIGVCGYVVKPVTSDVLLPSMEQAYREFMKRV